MRLVWTAAARDDLESIAFFVGVERLSPQAADQLIDELVWKCELRLAHPELSALRPDLGAGVREFGVGSYVVFYRLEGDEIQVLAVIHGARDIPAAIAERFRAGGESA